MSSISPEQRNQVIQRANAQCEYCLLPDNVSFYRHEIDHIIAEKHGGETHIDNLAYACWPCNRHKGSDLASIDPETKVLTALYNPRIQNWLDHFALEEAQILPLTAVGRVTVILLQINRIGRIEVRQALSIKGYYPSNN